MRVPVPVPVCVCVSHESGSSWAPLDSPTCGAQNSCRNSNSNRHDSNNVNSSSKGRNGNNCNCNVARVSYLDLVTLSRTRRALRVKSAPRIVAWFVPASS